MVNIGVFWNKKGKAQKGNGRSYIIYFNGNTRVISFKFPEQLVYEIDKYVVKLGLRNRSDLLRLLLIAFLKNMKIAEKTGLLDENDSGKNIKINLVIEFGDYHVSQVIDITTFLAGSYRLINVVETEKNNEISNKGRIEIAESSDSSSSVEAL
ncbi:hypothetical protein J4526_08190 [Desulfurococcaceae archaeon MEX13E-LK6-19]|nr:hypothetical protein J4526_08190 [Desulfurococcaceae archaeon MEX13E-LK6-19]